MKKILLSLSLVAAAMTANAQGTFIPVYAGGLDNPKDSVNSAEGFVAFEGTAPTSFEYGEVTSGDTIYLRLAGESAGYYVWGVNNGKYDATGANEAFGYTGSADGNLAFRIQAANTNTRIKFGLQTTDGKTFGYEHDFAAPANAAAVGDWAVFNVPFANFVEEDASGTAIGVAPTAAELAAVGQINVMLIVQSWCDASVEGCNLENNTISRYGEFWLERVVMTETASDLLSVTNANNIASSTVYPNPASGLVYANLNLKAASEVSVVVADLMGKEVAASDLGTVTSVNGQELFNAANLAKGMYTVTYLINGEPAKTELVVVK